jgi:para-nitrobenzyl esterase
MNIRMNRAWALALCWIASACGDGNPADPPDPTLVDLADGDVQGSIVGTGAESRQFLGIPYARPPVGDLRWKAPQKPEPRTTVLDATVFGKRCAQVASPTLMNAASDDEDCLYLNVWTPFPVPDAPLPVMLWIHGGGNVNGSASEPLPFINVGRFYSGEFLAANHDVVVVSINYRLGLFGFFEHPALTAEGSSGNQGLLDQQLAMQWVRDNIAKFGGDPANVTIFGESAGSFDVCMHVAAPSSEGLFHRAIGQSGGCTTVQPTKAAAEAEGATFGERMGCTGAGALACLRGKPAAEIMRSPEVVAGRGFGPSVDGDFMPDQPRTRYDAGQIAKVPLLLGSNTDEGTLFLPAVRPTTDEQYLASLNVLFGATAADVARVYPVSKFNSAMPNPPEAALARVIGDSRLVCTTFDTAVRAEAAGSAVFMYNFDIPVPASAVPQGLYLGATHGAELTSVFGTSPLFASDAPGKAASDLVQRYWTNFARTGDPNGGSDPTWPAFDASSNVRINLALQPSTVTNFRAEECAFWRAGYALQFPR